ncbi:MAG TPA: hypothetical protein VIT22_03045 [Pseudoxanthomonas sp.]
MEKAKPLELKRQVWPRLARAVLMGLGLALLAACDRATPEQALRAQLQEMQAAAAEGKISDFMDGVTQDFAGNGGMDRAALHNLLRVQVLGKANVGASTGPLEVEIQGDRAIVRFSAALTSGSGRFLPDSAQAYAITSGWRTEDGEWRVYYAQWEPKL